MSLLNRIKRFIRPKKYFTNTMKKYKKFTIGDYTYGKPNLFSPPDKVRIGKFCSIAGGVTVYTSTDHNAEHVSVYPFFLIDKKFSYALRSKGGVVIENDVWIGDGSTILDGVTIGNGAIIGAKSVVTKDVQPYEIVAGNPAKHIRYRFDAETINQLLQIQWWHWDIEKINENMSLLTTNKIDEFIALHTNK